MYRCGHDRRGCGGSHARKSGRRRSRSSSQSNHGRFLRKPNLELHGQRMIDRNFALGGFIKNQIKDLKAALEVAGKLGLRLPLTERVSEMFVALAQTGKEELDHSALILQLEAMQS